jgi:hypothetical protein
VADAASASFAYTVAQNDDISGLRSLGAIGLDIVAKSFRARSATFGILVPDHKRPNEVTSPEFQHRGEDISTAGHGMSTSILFLFRLLAACFCPTSSCHQIQCFSLGHARIVERRWHPFVDQIDHALAFSAQLSFSCRLSCNYVRAAGLLVSLLSCVVSRLVWLLCGLFAFVSRLFARFLI